MPNSVAIVIASSWSPAALSRSIETLRPARHSAYSAAIHATHGRDPVRRACAIDASKWRSASSLRRSTRASDPRFRSGDPGPSSSWSNPANGRRAAYVVSALASSRRPTATGPRLPWRSGRTPAETIVPVLHSPILRIFHRVCVPRDRGRLGDDHSTAHAEPYPIGLFRGETQWFQGCGGDRLLVPCHEFNKQVEVTGRGPGHLIKPLRGLGGLCPPTLERCSQAEGVPV